MQLSRTAKFHQLRADEFSFRMTVPKNIRKCNFYQFCCIALCSLSSANLSDKMGKALRKKNSSAENYRLEKNQKKNKLNNWEILITPGIHLKRNN